ncbi:MAG: EthD domain-containing protein [Pseudomonadaceae bacterium]|nr:EthD domain-containing protein [Pseudomonadaceae bacterium]
MIKLIGLMTRRPGMSHEAFREYYETRHRLIGEKYLAGGACRYMRRYLSSTDPLSDVLYDCILEVWYPDETAMQNTSARLALPAIAAEIAADEEQLFDRGKLLFYLANDVVSELPPIERS